MEGKIAARGSWTASHKRRRPMIPPFPLSHGADPVRLALSNSGICLADTASSSGKITLKINSVYCSWSNASCRSSSRTPPQFILLSFIDRLSSPSALKPLLPVH